VAVIGSLFVGIGLAVALPIRGSFVDDDGNIHEGYIEAIAAEGITRSCNPPINDRYCPDDVVTRGQMAAFLVRALGLHDDGGRNWFDDDDGTVFEDDINKLAASNVSRGCNPPVNDRFCPDRTVSRGEMAAFLARAYRLPIPGGNRFADDDDSLFEHAVEAIAERGISKGCNPPANTRFCPHDAVRRDVMATFIARAEGLPPIDVSPPGTTQPPAGPTEEWLRRAEALISVFENSTTEIQYGYAEDIGDGRGITAGRAGFTSATGDLVIVVRDYVAARPSTPLAAYLPVLEELAASGSSETSQLDGFIEDWQDAANDPVMRDIQDAVSRDLYFDPSQEFADDIGAVFPLTRAVLYGTGIQHGTWTDPDGLATLIDETIEDMGGTPGSGVDERDWLDTFLWVRRSHLEWAHDPATREAWQESVDRVDTWLDLLYQDLVWLDRSFHVNVYGDDFTIP
ncbi:MAG: chitosanase, partial [Acidimicrobiia bacterium]